MLGFFRRHTQSGIGKILMTFAMGLLIISFGVWGIGDIFRGRVDTSVAKVGKTSISIDDFQTAFRRQVDQLRSALGPEFDATQARAFGLDTRVLSDLVSRAVLDQEADHLGLVVPDAMILKEIHADPRFHGPTGQFDKNRFQALIREHGFTEQSFLRTMRLDLARTLLLDAVVRGVNVPNAMAGPLFVHQAEQRLARYVTLTPDLAGPLPPATEEQIKKHYDGHKAAYMAPEYRRFMFVRIDPAAIAKTIAVSDAEVQEWYEAHKSDYITPATRTLEQLILPTEAEARTAAEAVKGGKTFEAVATERGLTKDDISLGAVSRADFAKEHDATLTEAAFGTAAGAVSTPVKGPFGWVLYHVTATTAAVEKSFDELRPTIAADLAKEKAADEVYKRANALEDARGGGAPLEDAAKAVGLEATTIAASDAEGRDPSGATIPAVAGARALLGEAFKGQAGDDTDLVATDEGGYFVVRVDSVTPPAERPLETVKAQVTEEIEADMRRERLAKMAADMAAKGNKGTALDTMASALGRAALSSPPIMRTTATDDFSREVVTRLFEAPKDGFVFGPVGIGDSYVVMQLTSISKPDATSPGVAQQRDRLRQTLANELLETYVRSLEKRHGVKINESAFKTALGEP